MSTLFYNVEDENTPVNIGYTWLVYILYNREQFSNIVNNDVTSPVHSHPIYDIFSLPNEFDQE